MSGWLLLGLPGLAYVSFFESVWVAVGLLIGTYANWLFIAKPLRDRSEELGNALTIPEYLDRSCDDNSHLVSVFAALSMVAFFVLYTAAGFVAGGKLFSATFGIDYSHAVLLCAVLIAGYASFGGFIAVTLTDALQATLMLLALLLVTVLALSHANPEVVIATIKSQQPASSTSTITIISALAWGLGYFGQPHILTRFMAIESSNALTRSRKLAIVWTVSGLACAVSLGYLGAIILTPELLPGESEKVFIYLIQQLVYPALAGLCLAGILAAIMSTADSQILVAGAAFSHDLLGRLPYQLSNKLLLHRCTVAVICCVAALIAVDPGQLVFDMVAYAWAGFGASLGPCLIMSLYCSKTGRCGALSGILTGALAVFVWEQFDGGIFELYSLLPAFSCSFAAIVVGNYFYPRQVRHSGT